MKIIKNYHKDISLRQSMSKLSLETFGLDFEPFYSHGYWGKEYINVSMLDHNEIVSNISCYELEIEKDNKRYSAVQFGAVMTKENLRGKGLAGQLMKAALDLYKDKDVVFLFADEEAINFYSKFTFKGVKHHKYKQTNFNGLTGSKGRKLDFDKDRELIEDFVWSRSKNSKNDYVYGDERLKMFYLLYMYKDHIYLHDKGLLIAQKIDHVLWIHDYYGSGSIADLIGGYLEGISEIRYGFEAKLDHLEQYEDNESGLHVITKHEALLKPWSYPTTSVT